ncbi:hypothetical protein [Mucilaginibacter terrenus]|uniref:hypothetical protein n=1 Tax=Mucilaginibacter terrenus TaxID=2482727 RepID=UPI001401D020|nr:hypothetical protein [Mucilaginibacter terrenus]
MDTKIIHCMYCNKAMNYTDRAKRSYWLKTFFPFLSVRPYWCTHCLRTTYVWGKSAADK